MVVNAAKTYWALTSGYARPEALGEIDEQQTQLECSKTYLNNPANWVPNPFTKLETADAW